MKRIIVLLLACLLFAACGTPAATPAEPTPAPTEAVISEPESAAQDVPNADAPQGAVSEADVSPAPEETTQPIEARFADRFTTEPTYGENSYTSSTVAVSVRTVTVESTYAKLASYHVADIYVKDVTSIRAGAARGDFSLGAERHFREVADDTGALLAIVGDCYTHRDGGVVIRNGELYCSTPNEGTDLCVLYRDGRMETKAWGTFTMQEILDADPWQVWSFGPALLDEDGHAMDVRCPEIGGSNPRTAIGYYEPGHYCFVVVDGRQDGWSDGMKLPALSRLMEDLGCRAAYNLDGGASAQMYWNGEIYSRACSEGRRISDIVYLLPEA